MSTKGGFDLFAEVGVKVYVNQKNVLTPSISAKKTIKKTNFSYYLFFVSISAKVELKYLGAVLRLPCGVYIFPK